MKSLKEVQVTSCIIFACSILTEDRLFVLKEFLDEFEKDFSDSDIYVGINPGTVPSAKKLLKESKLNIVSIKSTSAKLYSLSDASAYQVALKSLKDSGKVYENYWFIHTKGGVNSHSDFIRGWYIRNLLQDRSYVENFLAENTDVGSYGILGLEYDKNLIYSETDTEISLFENNITKELPCTHAHFFYIHTLYVMRKEVVEKFFSLITDKWFSSRLDRYYFEGVFPFIVSRSGYFPYISNKRSMNGLDIAGLHRSWILDNNLISYEKYLDLYRTDHDFDQLNPHYDHSNT